jgi:acyl-CoA reductase-like NAD-dependent aldehyde dehydrogenase
MYTVTNPATGELIEEIENASDEEVRTAIGRPSCSRSAPTSSPRS